MSRSDYRSHNQSFKTDDSPSGTIRSNMSDSDLHTVDTIQTLDSQTIHTHSPVTTTASPIRQPAHIQANVRIAQPQQQQFHASALTQQQQQQQQQAHVQHVTQTLQPQQQQQQQSHVQHATQTLQPQQQQQQLLTHVQPITQTLTQLPTYAPLATQTTHQQPLTLSDLVSVIRAEIAQAVPPPPLPRQVIMPGTQQTAASSSHNGEARRHRAASLQSLNNLMTGLNLTDHRPSTNSRHSQPAPPTYIPAHEQALRFHKQDVAAHKTTSGFLGKIAEFMNYTLQVNPDMPEAAIDLTKQILEEAKRSNQSANLKMEGLDRASKVVNYYETPITKPIYPDRDDTDRLPPVFFNLRELLMVTGYFDPTDKEADFKHTWQKLLDYGTTNNFDEPHYLQALSAILKREAYETFSDFRSTNRSLDEILEYFAKVYTKKRSLLADRQAVDKFTRQKGESILVCMDRCIIAIDKLRHLYPEQGWPDMRQQMRRNILMQVIKEDTKRHIQMEEDDITESTGMPYDFDKLIRLADRYERHHNAAPKEELSTLFKVASGGLHTKPPNPDKQNDQLTHLKKDQFLQKKLDTLQAQIETLQTNNVRPYKNEGRPDRARQARRQDRSDSQRRAREHSLDRNRDLTPSKTNTPDPQAKTADRPSNTTTPTQQPYVPRNPFDRNRSRSPGYSSRSPPRRSQTPASTPYVSFSRDNSRSRSQSQQRDRSRSRSQNRSSSYNYPNRSNSQSRTDATTTHGHKAIYITINGQSYLAQPHKSEN